MSGNSFSFNFFGENKDNQGSEESSLSTGKAVMLEFENGRCNAEELVFSELQTKGGNIFWVVDSPTQSRDTFLGSSRDIEPGVYEGGLKVWECSLDLVDYMEDAGVRFTSIDNVLELGCGHGLPGIFALQKGAGCTLFSDFNAEVLQLVTRPNVLKNSQDTAGIGARSKFIAGDWDSVSNLLEEQSVCTCTDSFSWILTAETLYTEATTEKILRMIIKHLAKPQGVALIATKRYYFGTGGSVFHFLSLVENNKELVTDKVYTVEDGRSNIREILRVRWKAEI